MTDPYDMVKPPSVKRVLPLDGSCEKAKKASKKQHASSDEETGGGLPSTRQTAAAATASPPTQLGNGYDAVLSESEDLLQAAVEAQALGRLRMSASYLTLLHARLVGLGKRFDKANSSQGKAKVTRELSDMMPHVEFDTAMMEHLAKAAEELHNARCGLTTDKNSGPTNDVRALFASQLKFKLQERASETPTRKQTHVNEALSPLPNCNARELLAVGRPSSDNEDEVMPSAEV